MNELKGRVISEARGISKVLYEGKVIDCTLSGRFKYMVYSEDEYPMTGDYVIFRLIDQNKGVIERVLERVNKVSRFHSFKGKSQFIACNVDTLYICMSMNKDFNITKLQNFLTISYTFDGEVKILLTKSDLKDSRNYLDEIRSISNHEVIMLSAMNKDDVIRFKEEIKGKTSLLIGSSGVGKSTLVNSLLNGEILKTNSIRNSDAQGRHTTTYKILLEVLKDTYIIDTPGIRIVSSDYVEDMDDKFDDIYELSKECQFRDCTHSKEPDCAVKNAIQYGDLSNERLKAYNKVLKINRYTKRKEALRNQKLNRR